MAKYRKKPVVIEAVQFISVADIRPLLELAGEESFRIILSADGILYVQTLEGKMKADMNDWIIKGVQGELYPCKPDIFEATYEKVED